MTEAVRIRRRGGLGNILNSKSEYNRCHVARLRVEDEEEQKRREEEITKEGEQKDKELDKEQYEWERRKPHNGDGERRKIAGGSKGLVRVSKKRLEEEGEGATTQKRRKNELLREDLGEIPRPQRTPQGEQRPSLPMQQREEEEWDPIQSHRQPNGWGAWSSKPGYRVAGDWSWDAPPTTHNHHHLRFRGGWWKGLLQHSDKPCYFNRQGMDPADIRRYLAGTMDKRSKHIICDEERRSIVDCAQDD